MEIPRERLLQVQNEQLLKWKQRLNTKCFTALKSFTESENTVLSQDVVRGVDLDNFVSNWNPKYKLGDKVLLHTGETVILKEYKKYGSILATGVIFTNITITISYRNISKKLK